MKNNKILILVLVILVAIAAYFFINKSNGTLTTNKEAKSDFAIKDTESIDKIFMVNPKGKSVTLVKVKGEWLVDGEYAARPDNIRLLMKTFNRIDVRSPVPKAAVNNVIKQIATSATKVEIYQGEDEPSKTYYVGGATLDHQGTFMILETDGVKSSVPFIMYIPGNYGYLTTRFFTEAEQWRDAVVFKSLPEEIKSIEVTHHETPDESFMINNKNGEFSLFEIGSVAPLQVNPGQLLDYVERYKKIYYEMIDVESEQAKIDSIVASPPFITIDVVENSGKKNSIVLHHMPNFREMMDDNDVELEFDVDRMYGYLNNELFTYVQFATFDKITLPKSYFIVQK
ncbi:hypothetical protein N9242_02580 [Vicingaceae bacterium]|nr:hypothetical protein [Vicingaceae bacterium]